MSAGTRPPVGTYVYGGVALAVLVGLVLVTMGRWQVGVSVAGVALGVAGLARGLLPDRSAGLLRVRRRPSDVVCMLGLAVGLVVLAAVVPVPPA